MKKTIITALVVLLVMLAFSTCDGLITEPGAGAGTDKAEYTADGRKLVTVSINIGGTAGSSRSIDNDIAEENKNYMEVIFKYGPDYYRGSGTWGATLSVKVPEGTYPDATTGTDAIILVGRNSDKTLLATGTLKDTPVNVESGKEITFTVVPLTVNTSALGTQSFVITNTFTGAAAEFNGQTKNGLYEDALPCFQVPENQSITATLTIGGFGSTGTNIIVIDDSTASIEPKITFTGGLTGNKIDDGTISVNGGSSDVGTDGEFDIGFATKAASNYRITFEIPVVGFSQDPGVGGNAIIWNIRGGTKRSETAYAGDDASEGIMLLVATSSKRIVTVQVVTE